MQGPAGQADGCGSAIEALILWAGQHDAVRFESAVRYLSGHGFRTAAAHDFIRTALDRRLLIARTSLGEVRSDTLLIPASLKRGKTTERDVTRTMGEAIHRRCDPDGMMICLWLLAEGKVERPVDHDIGAHGERDRRIAKDFGRSHVPFGPILIGEHLLLRCRFGPEGILRSHRVEVR